MGERGERSPSARSCISILADGGGKGAPRLLLFVNMDFIHDIQIMKRVEGAAFLPLKHG